MFQTVKLNILIPLQYNHDDYFKTEEGHEKVSKAEIDICKEENNFSSAGWFHYCFRNKPIESNFQMANSPLLTNSIYKISRLEMDSVVRASVGLHKNENTESENQAVDEQNAIGGASGEEIVQDITTQGRINSSLSFILSISNVLLKYL